MIKDDYRRTSRLTGGLAVAMLALTACAQDEDQSADEYPADDIRIIVPYAAGGATDVWSRSLATHFESELGVGVSVENIPGASGALGQREMMNDDADGHTLQAVASTAMAIGPLQQDVGYTQDDVRFVGLYAEVPTTLMVHSNSDYNDAQDFMDAVESGRVTVGTHGAISQGALAATYMNEEYDTNFEVVPFDGQAEAETALLGENIDAAFIGPGESTREYFESGDFVPLIVDAPYEIEFLPDVPTFTSLGYDGVDSGIAYYGIGVHAETPDDVVDTLEQTLQSSLEDEDIVEQIGSEYIPEEFVGGDELGQLFEDQLDFYSQYIDEVETEEE